MDKTKNNGLHILLTLKVDEEVLLINFIDFDDFILDLLKSLDIEVVGKSNFIFPNNSFTAVYCLMESHLAIHTWPEMNKITCDIYLCNYSKDNTKVTETIASKLIEYFNAQVEQFDKIIRK